MTESPQSKSLGSRDVYCDGLEGYRRLGVSSSSTLTCKGIKGVNHSSFITTMFFHSFTNGHQRIGFPFSLLLNLCTCCNSLFNLINISALFLIFICCLFLNLHLFSSFQYWTIPSPHCVGSEAAALFWRSWTISSLSSVLGSVKQWRESCVSAPCAILSFWGMAWMDFFYEYS